MESLERELLLKDAGQYGYNLAQVSARHPAEVLRKMLVSEEGRILEGIPVVLAHIVMNNEEVLDLFELEESLPSNLRKRFRICVAVTYWFLVWVPDSKSAQSTLKKYLTKRDASTLESVDEKLRSRQRIPIGEGATYDPERLENTFKNYVVEQFAEKQNSLSRKLDLKRTAVFDDAVSELFTEKQRVVIMKVLFHEALTKTEKEYYSRVIKPRLKAIRNPDVQSIASTLLGY